MRATLILALAGGLTAAQSEPLTLDPDSGGAGTSVTASFSNVTAACDSKSVEWDGEGLESSAAGAGKVGFQVPFDASPTEHEVNVTCDGHTGAATFFVTEDGSTTSSTEFPTSTDTAPGETTTTVLGSSTSVPGSSVPGGGEVTTTTGPGVRPPPENFEQCEREASEADAQLVFEPRREMVVDRTYEVKAALGLEALPPDITFEGTTTVVTLPSIGCQIKASLAGADFDVTPKTDAEQSFRNSRVLQWLWDVRPKRVGDDLKLTLSFQAIFVEGGRTSPGQSVPHEELIDVNASPASFLRRARDGTSGFLTHPIIAPVTALIVTTAAAWLGRTLWKRLNAGANEEDGRESEASEDAGHDPPDPPS